MINKIIIKNREINNQACFTKILKVISIWVTWIEIGIGLIIIGLAIYSVGIFFFLDRGMLAIGNVLITVNFLDILYHGHNRIDRVKKHSSVLRQENQNPRHRVLFHWLCHDRCRLVYVHFPRIYRLNVRTISAVQILLNHHTRLRLNTSGYWPCSTVF